MSGIAPPSPKLSFTPSELAAALRKLFWLVHPVRHWPTIDQSQENIEPAPLLATAPFYDWREVLHRIQADIRPEAWTIEKKSLSGSTGLLILLRKNQRTFAIEILPLRSYRTAVIYHDYSRGTYLERLIITSIAATPSSHHQIPLVSISPAGLFYGEKLAVTSIAGIIKFFGLPQPLNPIATPEEFYAEISNSPLFNPKTFFQHKETQPTDPAFPPQKPVPHIEQFQSWCNAHRTEPGTAPSSISLQELRDKIEQIRAES